MNFIEIFIFLSDLIPSINSSNQDVQKPGQAHRSSETPCQPRGSDPFPIRSLLSKINLCPHPPMQYIICEVKFNALKLSPSCHK